MCIRDSQKHLRPNWAKGKFKANALPAPMHNCVSNSKASQDTQHPAPERPEPTGPNAAAEDFEGSIHRCHRLTFGKKKGDAAIGNETAECHDEGWNFSIGHEKAVEGPDKDAQPEAGNNAQYPNDRMANAQSWSKLKNLQHCRSP